MIAPQPGPQTEFLSSRADIVIYGGAAGGGKSYALLLEAARGTVNSRYAGVIFRRTSVQITAPGGLLEAAGKIYPKLRARARSSNNHLDYVFPNGSRVAFRHLQHKKNKEDWQGAELAFIGFDELTHFEEEQFWYLMSRNRSTTGIMPYIRATTNPAPGWVRNLLAPWIDPHFPNPAQPGELRHFTRVKGEFQWVGPEWRNKRGQPGKTITFIPSRVTDNPALMEANPEYIETLESLPDIDRKRLLDGDWNVFEGAFYGEFSEARHTISPPFTPEQGLPAHWKPFGGLDWGYHSPFAFGLLATDGEGNEHVIETIQIKGLTNDEQADRVCALLAKWGVDKRRCPIAYDPSMRNKQRARQAPGFVGEADIEAFQRAGLLLAPADNDRRAGHSRVRKSLHNDRLKIWKGWNTLLIAMFPLAPFATPPDDPEDQAAGEWEHLLDVIRYALMTRPVVPRDPNKPRATKSDIETMFKNRDGRQKKNGWAL